MAHFTKAAVTDEGNELLNEMMAGRYIRVTRAAGGTGTVEEEKLHEQTGLQEEKQALTIIDDTVDKQGRTIAIQITNAEESYPLEQVGVFGKLEDEEGEKLLFILQDNDPITVPDTNASTFMLNIYAHMNINNVGRFTVTIDKTGIVDVEFLERKLSEVQSIPGEGAPTPKTDGKPGQHYFDAESGTEYICKQVNEDGTCVWEEAGGAGVDFTTDESLDLSERKVLSVTTPVKRILTQEEFDVLPEEQKNKGLFVIKGSGSGDDLSIYDLLEKTAPPEVHRNFYRGKNLGGVVTDKQAYAIQDGTFKGLFVGDYWTIGGVNWRIADMDYFLRCGDTEFTDHHLVIVPDTSLYNAKMNTSNTTDGAYMGSEMYKNNLTQAKSTIASAFGELVLTHKDYLTNAVTNGYPSAGAWVDSSVELMNEIMVYGTHVYAPANNGTTIPNKYTTGKQQFALFALDPKKVNIRVTYWLMDVVSAANFARVDDYGYAGYYAASNSLGVRPYFCIGKKE